MKTGPERLPTYLQHILQAIDRIETYTTDLDESGFIDAQMVQDAVIRNFEIIGEASRNIVRHNPAFATRYPDLPLAVAYEMRNALAHGYSSVDLEIVWRSIGHDLPDLRAQVSVILTEQSKDPT